jgi:hypothetical protein
MNYFNFKKRNIITGPHLLGAVLIMAGLFVLVSPVIFENEPYTGRVLIVGVGAIILGLIIVTSFSGTLIDFSEKRFKEYMSLGGYKIGEWTTFPLNLTVKVISNSYIRTNTPNGISPTFSGRVTDFKTMICSDDSQPVLSIVYSNRDKAVKQAKRIAFNLNADLVLDIPN